MKRKIVILSAMIAVLFSAYSIYAQSADTKLQSKIEKGVYIPEDLLTPNKLKELPVPSSKEDYAFYQSIDKVSNIVVGTFSGGENKVSLITDNDSDGKVDSVVYYFFDTKKLMRVANANAEVSPETFKNMKDDIFNGVKKTLSPNKEGALYLKTLLKSNSPYTSIFRVRQGFKINVNDADNQKLFRLSFLVADNDPHGIDVAFQVIYSNVRDTKVKPVIEYSVYCKKSYDPFLKEKVKDLLDYTKDYYVE